MFEKLKGLRLFQRVIYIGASWRVKEILEDGRVVLGSMSKNIDDKIIRAKDCRYVYPNKDRSYKRWSSDME